MEGVSPASLQKFFECITAREENRYCADCSNKAPKWASTSFGILVCLRCSGIHRKLQVHITKVKSLELDVKWAPEILSLYKAMNNYIANSYWEAKMPQHYAKPSGASDMR